MRIAIVGAGIAGALLAWRIRRQAPRAILEIFTKDGPDTADASGASGGIVRGFEVSPHACAQAAESLAELRGSPMLRDWACYQETGSLYLLPADVDAAESLSAVEQALPGSAAVVGPGELAGHYPFRGLQPGTVGVAERQAGYISPRRLRGSVVAWLTSAGVPIRQDAVAVTADPAVRLADGTTRRYDLVVVAAGPWTPSLLARSGLPGQQLRTKQVQYSLCRATVPGLTVFVQDGSGFYGRPADRGTFLFGLPCDHWDVDPGAVTPDQALATATAAYAQRSFSVPVQTVSTVASCDCYRDTPGLRLRRCAASPALLTFTGGSGGAAKTALAASRAAADTLLSGPRAAGT